MRYSFVLILVFFTNLLSCIGQTIIKSDYLNNSFTIKIDERNNFVKDHVLEVSFAFRGDSVFAINVFPKTDDKFYLSSSAFLQSKTTQAKFKFFDLDFIADRLIFEKEFPSISIPSPLEFKNILSRLKPNSVDSYHLIAVQKFSDSTLLTYSETPLKPRHSINRQYIPTVWGIPAIYLNNLDSLGGEVARDLKLKSKLRNLDSIIVFSAIVESKRGEYDILKIESLIYGRPSQFSNSVYNVLTQKTTREWRAAAWASNGQKATTRIKIYAELKRDGTILFKLPKKLGSWTGD